MLPELEKIERLERSFSAEPNFSKYFIYLWINLVHYRRDFFFFCIDEVGRLGDSTECLA